MTTFHFVPEKVHLLTWFNDLPVSGDPLCICSFCGKLIAAGELPLRIFRSQDNTELRLHIACAEQVIVEMAPKSYADHPAFQLGRDAYGMNARRGANPYGAGVNRSAWFAGWDDAWAKR